MVSNERKNDYVSQQLSLDPKAMLNMIESERKASKGVSMNNIIELNKNKENATDRSNYEETKTNAFIPAKLVALPKVSPFAKSIPIKKYSVKLFSEDDEYLCN